MKFKSEVQLEALNNATVDTDKFLVSDSTTVKYRTGAQLLSDLGVSGIYVPYTGATGNVDLGTHTLLAKDLIINHSSGSGVAASITKNGSGEALTVIKGSGSGNAMSVTGGLTSLVNLSLSTVANATGDFLTHSGSTINKRTPAQVLSDIGGQAALTNPITGTGTTNYVSKFTGSTTLGNSQIFDNGTNVGIGTTSPFSKLEIVGPATSWANSPSIIFTDNAGTINSRRWLIGNVATDYGSLNFAVSSTNSNDPSNSKMTITKEGNVGIGTTSPSTLLHLYKTSFPVLTIGSGVITANMGIDTSDLLLNIGTETNHAFKFTTNNSEKMRITSGGNVGIGTSSPQRKLDIVGDHTTSTFRVYYPELNVTGQDASVDIWASEPGISFNGSGIGSNVNGQPYYGRTNPALGQGFIRFIDGTTAFHNSSTDAVYAERMRITPGGSVGIGTSSPISKLNVNTTDSANNVITVTNGTQELALGVNNGSGGSFLFENSNNALRLGTAGTERMRVTNSGNVGIGTSSPASANKLEVNGRVFTDQLQYTRAINISDANLDDYVNAGFYNGTNITNAPSSGWFWVTVERYSDTVDWAHQTATTFGSGNTANLIYTRTKTGGIWTNWKRLIDWTDINGTTNYVSKFTGNNSLGNSQLFDNGTNVGIGTTSPGVRFVNAGAGNASLPTLGSGTVGSQALLAANGLYGMYSGVSNSGDVWHQVQRNDGNTSVYNLLLQPSGGTVAIGTYAPGFATTGRGILSLNGSNTSLMEFQTGGVFKSYLYQSGTSFEIYDTSTILFNTNGGERMRITSVGNIGIGTSGPSAKLNVYGDLHLGAYSNLSTVNFENRTGKGIFGISTNGVTNAEGTTITYSWADGGHGPLKFNNASSEVMRLTAIGNVGINTTAPIHKLSVNGKIGGDVWSAGYIEFLATTETVISAESNVVLGYSQNVVVDNEGSVGVGTIAPEVCAAVEIKSTTQGFLLPRMRTGDRDNIGSPIAGLMIFNEDTEQVDVFTSGSGWRTLAWL